MKKVTIVRQGQALTITAPEGKVMSVNEGHLAHGILSIGEFGASGVKIACFSDWSEVIFDSEDHGYTINEDHPF
jgi:hypothetical protein